MAELVYIGTFDNTIDLRLESPPGTPIDLSGVTIITANINGLTVSSSNQSTDKIRWLQSGYETGEIRCKFGATPGLREGIANCWITIFDNTVNLNGVVFEPVKLTIEKLI
jgi:hypothetical protein